MSGAVDKLRRNHCPFALWLECLHAKPPVGSVCIQSWRTISSRGSLAVVACLLALNCAAQAGRTQLSLAANAYHFNDRFEQVSFTSAVLSASVYAEDETGDPPANTYGSIHQARASGEVSPVSISLYSRAYSYTRSSTIGYSSFADSNAVAQVTTPFRIQGGGAPGSSGTLVARLDVSGAVHVDPAQFNPVTSLLAQEQAYMYFWATGLNASGCTYYVDAGCLDIIRNSDGNFINSNNALRTWTLNIPFSFDAWGQFSLQMWTLADTYVQTGVPALGGFVTHFAESDFRTNGLRWAGIDSVLDANGVPVSGWTIESLPGVDLTLSAVPEPPAGLLMLGGLLGVALLKRRPRQV
jgi:hypothetical protein